MPIDNNLYEKINQKFRDKMIEEGLGSPQSNTEYLLKYMSKILDIIDLQSQRINLLQEKVNLLEELVRSIA
jgi:hypothetical protein